MEAASSSSSTPSPASNVMPSLPADASNPDAPSSSSSSMLKRSGSWRRFKESVKEKVQTVQGWMGGSQQQHLEDEDTPSAVFPSKEVTSQRIDVQHVLHATNCYSGGGGGGAGAGGRWAEQEQKQRQQQLRQQQQLSQEVPQIVVTSELERRQQRRSPSTRSEGQRQQHRQHQPVGNTPTAPVECPPRRWRREEEDEVSSSSAPAAGMTPEEREDEEMKKRVAVMKIKQAIFSMNAAQAAQAAQAAAQTEAKDDSALMLQPAQQAELERRRNSDICSLEVATAKMAVTATTSTTSGAEATAASAETAAAAGSRGSSGRVSPNAQGRRKSAGHALGHGGARLKGENLRRASSMKRPAGGGGGGGAAAAAGAKPKRPMIWEHFDALPSNSQHGKCKACRMNVSCKYNTGNFVRHLQIAHKDIYRQYQNKIEAQWTRSMLERNLKA